MLTRSGGMKALFSGASKGTSRCVVSCPCAQFEGNVFGAEDRYSFVGILLYPIRYPGGDGVYVFAGAVLAVPVIAINHWHLLTS